jgi:cytochrome c
VPSRGKLETGAGAPAPSAAPTDREQRTGAAADVPAAAERAAEGAKSAGEAAAGGATGSGAGGLPAGPQGEVQEGHTYGAFSARDQRIWQAETEKFVQEGHRVFHDAKAFGGTIGISCDMCHPDAANTHPETYPKFQVQLGRVALLRDMINWCIQNPTKGKPLADDDDRLKAMEAYILAQRKGTALEFGKH